MLNNSLNRNLLFRAWLGALASLSMGFMLFGCQREPPAPATQAVAPTAATERPYTISASCNGSFSDGYPWYLSVNSAGQAELTILNYPNDKHQQFQISREQMQSFEAALKNEKFFYLDREFGHPIYDGSTQTLTVTSDHQANSVRIYFLPNEDNAAKRRDVPRALRMMVLVRTWISDQDAVDLSAYNREDAEAARGFTKP